MNFLHLVKFLPQNYINFFSKKYFYNQILNNSFRSDELEWDHLHEFVSNGDFAIDIGANIGRYSLKLSNLVGKDGHVMAVEPLKIAFNHLEYFINKLNITNITPLNLAVSLNSSFVNILQKRSLGNYYFETFTQSSITNYQDKSEESSQTVLTISLDNIIFPSKVRFIKIDTEGHEFKIILGAIKLIEADLPIILVEESEQDFEIFNLIKKFGYERIRMSNNTRNSIYKVV